VDITVYAFEDAYGVEQGCYRTTSADEAREHAQTNELRVVSQQYRYVDSELVPEWDFTPAVEDDD
jgi:hypothetical protein